MTPTRVLQKLILPLAVLLIPLLASCSSRPGGYDGYMTRSYTVRGQRYHPMSVDAALKFKETCGLHAEAFSAAEVKHGPRAR